MEKSTHFPGLSGNQLKIIALVAMTCDHVGLQLLPQFPVLRIIGRLAFPIFAYMIAEGCRYTHNRRKYLLTMCGFAAVCQAVYFFATGSLYMSVLVSFSVAIGLICLLDRALKDGTPLSALTAAVVFQAVILVCWYMPGWLPQRDLGLDYGFWGIMLPCLVFFQQEKRRKLAFFTFGLVMLALVYGGIQWYALLSLPLLALYNGKRGKARLKNLFYIYYPAHLVAIYLLSLVL